MVTIILSSSEVTYIVPLKENVYFVVKHFFFFSFMFLCVGKYKHKFDFAAVFTLVIAASHQQYRLQLTEAPASLLSLTVHQLNKEHL